MRLESELGRGTTAVVWLPRQPDPHPGAGQSPVAAGEGTAGQPSG